MSDSRRGHDASAILKAHVAKTWQLFGLIEGGNRDGRGDERQYASSETSLSGFAGLGIEFVTNREGVVTDLLIKHVSGDYRLAGQK